MNTISPVPYDASFSPIKADSSKQQGRSIQAQQNAFELRIKENQLSEKAALGEVKTEQPAKDKQEVKSKMEDLAQDLNKVLENRQTNLKFKVDGDIHQVVISVVDTHSGEVIKTIPSEDMIEIAKRLAETGSGLTQEAA